MQFIRAVAISILFSTLAGGAATAEPANLTQAAPGYTYFNRSGATAQDYDTELRNCVAMNDTMMRNSNMSAGLAFNMVWDGMFRRVFHAAVQDCMVARGWQVMRLPEDEGKSLAALDPTALTEKLSPWVGSATPPGEVATRWDNDAANPATVRDGGSLGPTAADDSHSLSLAGVLPVKRVYDLGTDSPQIKQMGEEGTEMRKAIRKSLEPEEVDSVAADKAILIFTLRSTGKKTSITLQRMGPDPDTSARLDKMPSMINLAFTKTAGQGEVVEQTFAFAVPTGKWRLQHLSPQSIVDFCLGAPFVTLNAGDVVNLGTFDVAMMPYQPDMTSGPAEHFLSASPKALQRLKAASWTNGGISQCPVFGLPYALEFPNTPFAKGYHWGSRVNAQ